MFLPLDLLSEYRIQHGAIGHLYVTSSYPSWIFCRGVAGFATECPCGVWCRGLTTYLLHVGPFWKSTFKQQLGCRFDMMDSLSPFFVLWHMQLYMSWYIISFFGFIFISQILFLIFSCTPVLTFSIDVVFILSTCWYVIYLSMCKKYYLSQNHNMLGTSQK